MLPLLAACATVPSSDDESPAAADPWSLEGCVIRETWAQVDLAGECASTVLGTDPVYPGWDTLSEDCLYANGTVSSSRTTYDARACRKSESWDYQSVDRSTSLEGSGECDDFGQPTEWLLLQNTVNEDGSEYDYRTTTRYRNEYDADGELAVQESEEDFEVVGYASSWSNGLVRWSRDAGVITRVDEDWEDDGAAWTTGSVYAYDDRGRLAAIEENTHRLWFYNGEVSDEAYRREFAYDDVDRQIRSVWYDLATGALNFDVRYSWLDDTPWIAAVDYDYEGDGIDDYNASFDISCP